MRFEYNPKVNLLIKKQSNKKVDMRYLQHKWQMPKIAQRPPYYTDPKYGFHYPNL
ncbi:MAG: hypothetical protein ABF649_10445 [Bacillus sp. (in: firmicutes)]